MIEDFDIAMLRVFNQVMQNGSRDAAAKKLKKSLPNISYQLKKLERITGEVLFTKNGANKVPTSRAIELHRDVMPLLEGLEKLLTKGGRFSHIDTKKHFTVFADEYFTNVVGPILVSTLESTSSDVTVSLEMNSISINGHLGSASLDTKQMIMEGEIDVVISTHSEAMEDDNIKRQLLIRDPLVLVYNQTLYEIISRSKKIMNIDQIRSTEHLSEIGLLRKSGQSNLGSYSAALNAVKRQMYYSVFPQRLVENANDDSLTIISLGETYDVYQYWHKQHDENVSHKWMRHVIKSVSSLL